jgi:hypothetical protein
VYYIIGLLHRIVVPQTILLVPILKCPDRGMCCTFNVDDPEELFAGETFAGLINDLDSSDRANAFTSSVLVPMS